MPSVPSDTPPPTTWSGRGPLRYPDPPRGDVVDNHHGERVADPFRILEEPDAPATVAFVEAENALTESVLSAVDGRDGWRARLEELWDFARFGVPFERGGRFFQFRNAGLQNQPVLYVMASPDDDGRPLLDPNALAEDGTVAVTGLGVANDGQPRRLCDERAGLGLDDLAGAGGRDRGRPAAIVVEWSKFSGAAWRGDGAGLLLRGDGRAARGGRARRRVARPRRPLPPARYRAGRRCGRVRDARRARVAPARRRERGRPVPRRHGQPRHASRDPAPRARPRATRTRASAPSSASSPRRRRSSATTGASSSSSPTTSAERQRVVVVSLDEPGRRPGPRGRRRDRGHPARGARRRGPARLPLLEGRGVAAAGARPRRLGGAGDRPARDRDRHAT